ncbi:MAG TPA: PHP domain-containing protein, partial [Polyangiaceae bacterium]|nr:PHP domain-containing protein [Polyangiaceae bacterium]
MLKPPLPVHVKSDYSLGRAVGTPAELAACAAAQGISAIALTDFATLAGQVEFHDACRAHGVKPLTGVEFPTEYPSEDRQRGRVVVLARDVHGYRSLCRLVTDWNAVHRSGVALLQTENAPEHLFVLTDEPDTARGLLAHGFDRSGLGLLLVRPSNSIERERSVLLAGASLELRVVADLDVTMPLAGDRALLALATSVHARIAKRRSASLAARSLDSGAHLFDDLGEVVRSTHDIAAACELELTVLRAPFDESVVAHTAALVARCERWPPPTSAHRERLYRELAVIAELGLARYFLAAAEIAEEARGRGIFVTARGSAVSSLVVHALGLSQVDPVAQALYFERFVRTSRKTPPDIDLDVASDRRDELIEWTLRRFGRSHAAPVGAYQTFQRRSAYRDALSALGMRASDVERFAATLPDDELDLPIPADALPPRYRTDMATIERLIGRPRHLSTHPSALALSNTPLVDSTPLVRAPKGGLVTQVDGHGLSRLGLLKVDLLGNRALAELDEVARITGTDPLSRPQDDARTLEAVGRADTVACNQLESPLMRSVLRRMPIA